MTDEERDALLAARGSLADWRIRLRGQRTEPGSLDPIMLSRCEDAIDRIDAVLDRAGEGPAARERRDTLPWPMAIAGDVVVMPDGELKVLGEDGKLHDVPEVK